MKTIKPGKLGVLTRAFERQRQPYFCVAVLAFTDFGPEPALFEEADLWKFVGTELGKDIALDECMPKPQGEILVHGSCFVPGGAPKPASAVRVRVANVDKTLYVVGDRSWRWDGTASDPAPFEVMPVTWSRAYGGEKVPANPVGLGAGPVLRDGKEVHLLPNVEDPKCLIKSRGERPTPVGFEPYDLTWPQRWSKMGTYDEKWMREDMPGLARDHDPTCFMTAPPDQWVPDFFQLTEAFTVENMHPKQPTLAGRLPGVVARCFFQLRGDDAGSLRELPLRLDTVRLFPRAMRAALVYRGVMPIDDDDGDDVTLLMLAAEDQGEPRSIEHYEAALARRLDPERGHIHSLRQRDLLPAWAGRKRAKEPDALERLLGLEGFAQRNLSARVREREEQLREAMVAAGADPASLGMGQASASTPPDPEDLADFIEKEENEQADAEAREAKVSAESEARARKAYAEAGLDYDAAVENAQREEPGPPKFSADAELERMRDLQTMARNGNVETPELDAALADPETTRKLRELEQQQLFQYRKLVHHRQVRAKPLDGDARDELRERVILMRQAGESLARLDLTGADLSDLDLAGVDMTEALLESASLRGANLAGAVLAGAVLAFGDLRGATMTGAELRDANLGGADLRGAKLDGGIDMKGAVLAKADLRGATLAGAKLDVADLSEAKLEDAVLDGAELSRSMLVNNDLSGVSFKNAKLSLCDFIEAIVERADFSGATVESCGFIGTRGDRADFGGAKIDRARMVQGASFRGCNFKGASVRASCLRETDFTGSDFSGADLEGSDLSKCALSGAKLVLANAKNALFIRADLSGADLEGANLQSALLTRAKIAQASFRDANLFWADFLRAEGDAETSFKDANARLVRYAKPS